jgi:hypothetical protein
MTTLHFSAMLVTGPLAPWQSPSLHRNVFLPIQPPVVKRDRAATPIRAHQFSSSSKGAQQWATVARAEAQFVEQRAA